MQVVCHAISRVLLSEILFFLLYKIFYEICLHILNIFTFTCIKSRLHEYTLYKFQWVVNLLYVYNHDFVMYSITIQL